MRKRLIGVFMVCIGVLLAVNAGLAEEKRKTRTYTGIVQDVDQKTKTIIVNKPKQDLGMVFDVSNTLFENAKGLEGLTPGDNVVVEFDARLGKTIAVTITKEQ
jgi:hypothetical protein